MKDSAYNKAFSILEIAIVITVISLLISSVIVGASLKHKMEISNVVSDISTINQAVKTFKEKYSGIPGDLYNAKEVFGSNVTENGNGNNSINDTVTQGCDGNGTKESLLFWQHLALAGLINGNYNYCDDNAKSRMSGPLKYSVYDASTIEINNQDVLAITFNKHGGGAIVSTKESYDIDNKYDNSSADADTDFSNNTGTIWHSDGTNVSPNDCITSSFDFNLQNKKEQACKITFLLTGNK